MNREIKFRAWDKVNKNMLYDVATGVITIWDYARTPGSKERSAKSDDCDFMQFTGLKDKNGKEIYEKDIVMCYDKSGEKVYNRQVDFYGFREEIWSEVGDDGNCESVEVIGNIYENPNLLN